MASDAQVAANRANAKASTGPRTAAGQAASSRNALRHGLRAGQPVVFDESLEDYEAHLAGLTAALQPADAAEAQIVERIASCAWRLKRVGRAEASMLNHIAESITGGGTTRHNPYSRMFGGVSTLTRYEAAIDRALDRAFRMLERAQARRRRGGSSEAAKAMAVTGEAEAVTGEATAGGTTAAAENGFLPNEANCEVG